MDFSYVFRSAVPLYECFVGFGFEKRGGSYVLKRDLAGTDFYALLTVTGVSQKDGSLSADTL